MRSSYRSSSYRHAPFDEGKRKSGELRVHADAQGMRLDAFLSRFFQEFSRGEIQSFIREGNISVNNTRKRPAFRLGLSDLIRFDLPTRISFHDIPAPSSMAPEIIHEDDACLVINKPPGIAVHPVAGNLNVTVMNMIALSHQHCSTPPRPVHRLDRDVSGLLLCAKDKENARFFSTMFDTRSIRKTYLAILEGELEDRIGTIETPVQVPRKHSGDTQLLSSKTEFRRLAQSGSATIVLFFPLTGRRHQLRQHARAIGHPIVGDSRYGKPSLLINRPALHALRLVFVHPMTNCPISLIAPLPRDFLDCLRYFRGKTSRESSPS